MKLAVGFFDGVHLGHRAILAGAEAALTFRAHPLSVLAPDRAPSLIMASETRLAAIRACGIERLSVLDFTPELARTEPEDFVGILKGLSSDGSLQVRCGANWRFGCGGRGDAEFLRAQGVEVEVVPFAVWRGEPVSSSRIRRCLAEGQVEEAEAMLGRSCEVIGDVAAGKGLGADLGYPTLNVVPDHALGLRRGVYAVELAGARGVANFGLAPTLGARAWREPVLEVHVLDPLPAEADGRVTVRLARFLRDERTFSDLEELKKQIADDCARVCG